MKSKTIKVRFKCPYVAKKELGKNRSRMLTKKMEIIKSCHCHNDCQAHTITNLLPSKP